MILKFDGSQVFYFLESRIKQVKKCMLTLPSIALFVPKKAIIDPESPRFSRSFSYDINYLFWPDPVS